MSEPLTKDNGARMNEPLTKDKIAFLYLTEEEQKMETHDALLQIILGLQTCQTKEAVIELLQDVRALQQRIDYANVASAVRLLREKIEGHIKACDSLMKINHDDVKTLSELRDQLRNQKDAYLTCLKFVNEVFGGVDVK